MTSEVVRRYEAAVAAERKAFRALENKAGSPEYESLKASWVEALKRTEAARAAMLRAWKVDL